MANWQCDVCRVFLEADDEGQEEPCPRCGVSMVEIFLQEET